jgi:hypothetical protein
VIHPKPGKAAVDDGSPEGYRCFMPRKVRFLLPFAALALFAAGCTVNQVVAVKADGSGTASLHAEVSPLLADYISSLAEVSGKASAANAPLFDVAGIKKDFSARPGITVKKAVTPNATSLDLDIGFASIQDVFTRDDALKSSGALTYSEAGGKKTIRLHLDRTNYTQLSALFPMLNDPTLASLGPQVNDTTTEKEYLDMVSFTIGDTGPVLVQKSFITLTIDPEGDILSQAGGTISGGAVVFRIPLIRLLVLDKPLDYSVSWK